MKTLCLDSNGYLSVDYRGFITQTGIAGPVLGKFDVPSVAHPLTEKELVSFLTSRILKHPLDFYVDNGYMVRFKYYYDERLYDRFMLSIFLTIPKQHIKSDTDPIL